MDWITDPQAWIALLTLTALEIVLGIDNIVFISILSGKLPEDEQARARTLGLGAAMVTRIALLFAITWVMSLTTDLFHVFSEGISGRDIILIIGGGFLIAKSTHEIHERLEGDADPTAGRAAPSLMSVLVQIALLDIVFSLDSVITAVGMAEDLAIMVAAVVIAVLVMMLAAGAISDFVHHHPTIKMLALSFLLLIGVTLVAEGLDRHIPKGYIYSAMAFSVFVEMLNLRASKKRRQPVELHEAYLQDEGSSTEMAKP